MVSSRVTRVIHSWKITSDASFVGTFYAPEADFTISGVGVFYGAALAHSVSFRNGAGASFHFDEALLRGGGGTPRYAVASWVEDVR